LAGSYAADYSVATEKLTVLPDGKFTQQVMFKSTSQVVATNGTWTYYPESQRVRFIDSFLTVMNGFGQQNKEPVAGTASLPILSVFGKVQIGGDPSITYKKQANPH
jgi:hypothetical protein